MSASSRFLTVGLILSVGFVLVAAGPSWATFACGYVIPSGTVTILTHDLTCESGGTALTVEGGSILNLGGHTIDCVNEGRTDIQVNGGGSIVLHGRTTNCDIGVEVAGTGRHIVTKVTATTNTTGFRITSSHNELGYNQAFKNHRYGFWIPDGNDNTLKANVAKENMSIGFRQQNGNDNTYTKNREIRTVSGPGFEIVGNRTQVTHNLAKVNGNLSLDPGFSLKGSNHTVSGNRPFQNSGDGFWFLPGSGHTVLNNTAKKNSGNGIYVQDGAINMTLLGNVANKCVRGIRAIGNNAEVIGNTANRNDISGIVIGGSNKTVTGNTANRNGREGIRSFATDTTFFKNVALRNGVTDLVDTNSSCDNNTWKKNRFQTSNQSCIE